MAAPTAQNVRGEAIGTQAVVRRSHVLPEALAPAREGVPVRFTCFDKLDGAGKVPGSEGCVQMSAPAPEGYAAAARGSREGEVFDDPLGDSPCMDE